MTTVAYRRASTPDPTAAFWRLAADAGAHTADRGSTYERLKAQYRSTFPDAAPAEYEAAMARIAKLCRV